MGVLGYWRSAHSGGLLGVADAMEQRVGSIPFIGDLVNSARGRAQAEFRDAALQRVGAPLGKTITETGSEGIEQAHRLVNEAYDAASKSMPTLNIADDFSGQIDDMISGFNEMGYSPSTIKQFKRMVDDKVLGRIGDSGELSAEGLKRLDSELGKLTSKGAPEMREMAGQLKRTMMDMAAEQSPEYAAQLAKADDAFKNMAVLDRAGAKAEEFTPKQLEAAIKANDTTARKNAFAQGRGPMRDLSKAAQTS